MTVMGKSNSSAMMLNRDAGPIALRAEIRSRLRIPVISAPMFLVSGPDMVIAAGHAGIIGALPSTNARTPEILELWMQQIVLNSASNVPFAINLVVHNSNVRREADLEILVKHRPPIVVTSVGPPGDVLSRVHAYGGVVFADVASTRHAKRVVDAGADGLVLLTAGAGGQTGWLNPFAFVAEIRSFYDGPIAVAGCISHGRDLKALEMLGADLGYMGTAFLASTESSADEDHKLAVVKSSAEDVLITDVVTGIQGSFLRSGLEAAGLLDQLDKIAPRPVIDFSSWRNVWSAGQGVGHIDKIASIAAIVDRVEKEYIIAGVGGSVDGEAAVTGLKGGGDVDIL